MQSFGIVDNSNMQLIRVLFNFSGTEIKHAIFALQWNYPVAKKDYLDASALLVSNNGKDSVIDYDHKYLEGIVHSGDVMNDTKRIGNHKIEVALDKIPSNFYSIYFTLSAYTSATLSAYPNPTVTLYDKNAPSVELCSYSVSSAGSSQAVIMCNLTRIRDFWIVEEKGIESNGNAIDYSPLWDTIHKTERNKPQYCLQQQPNSKTSSSEKMVHLLTKIVSEFVKW